MVLLTSKGLSRGETIVVCQKKSQLNGRAKMNAKVYLLPPKRANSCAKKWSTYGKANMEHGRRSRP
jgi:hypothetical protein